MCGNKPVSHSFNTPADFGAATLADIIAADELGNTVLHAATRRREYKKLIAALQRVPPELRSMFVNSQTHSDAGRTGRRTALHEAALRGDVKAATFLLMHGARIDIRDGHGRTALEIWARMRHPIGELCSVISLMGLVEKIN